MNITKITQLLLLIVIFVIVGWDIVPATNNVKGDTVSEQVIGAVSKHGWMQIAAGMLMAHLLLPSTALGVWGYRFSQSYPWVGVLCGVVLGMILWSQKLPK